MEKNSNFLCSPVFDANFFARYFKKWHLPGIVYNLVVKAEDSRQVVPNVFTNRVNVEDKKSVRAYFEFENKNMSRISLFKT